MFFKQDVFGKYLKLFPLMRLFILKYTDFSDKANSDKSIAILFKVKLFLLSLLNMS